MFGRKSQGFVQMYEYGCRNRPITGLDAALQQMEWRVQLWNRFVAIERDVRQGARLLLSNGVEHSEIRELKKKIASLRASIVERQRSEGRNSPAVNDLKQSVLASRAALAGLVEVARLNRREQLQSSGVAFKALLQERVERVRQAQRDSKLYWCNSDDVRHAYELARVQVMRAGTELREHFWNGSGRVSVRFQRGLPVRTAFTGRSRRLQIDPIPDEAWNSPVRSTRRRLAKSKVRIRVASTPGEPLPVWLEIPVVIHRPMPPQGMIRSAALIRERLALSWRYRLIITVACANPPAAVAADRPSMGIDLGWRVTTEGLRLAYWADTLGAHGELVIPASDVEQFAKVRGLRSVLDKQFTQIRDAVLAWRAANPPPAALSPLFDRVAADESRANLLGLVDAWRSNRAAGDDEIVSELLEWRKKHLHLWTWAVNLRDQLARKRLDLFRNFAAVLVRRYGTIFLEDLDLRWFSRNAPPEIKGVLTGGKYRVLAAPGILRQVIENACRRTGVRLEYIKARNTTKACHVCGQIEEWNAARQLVHTCGCGANWDQDYNAAVQILRAGETQTRAGTVQESYAVTAAGSSEL